jgi:hypothetical protein
MLLVGIQRFDWYVSLSSKEFVRTRKLIICLYDLHTFKLFLFRPYIISIYSQQRNKSRTSNIHQIYVNNCPIRCYLVQFLFPANCSTYFRWNLHPSSGARVNCNYSIWHWSNRMLTSIAERQRKVAYGSISVRCCNYNLLALLLMGEDINRNMWNSLQGIKTALSSILLEIFDIDSWSTDPWT